MISNLQLKKGWQALGPLVILVSWLAGCTQITPPAASPSEETPNTNPYSQFRQAVNEVEPLIDPNLEDITVSQFRRESLTAAAPGTSELSETALLGLRDNLTLITVPTLLAFNEQMYQRLIQAGYSGVLDMNTLKATDAIQQFCQGSGVDLLTINRAMTQPEIEACQRKGRQPLALAVGKDPLLLVVNKQNDFVRGVDLKKLEAILTRKRWSEVDPSWPQDPIQRSMVGPNSSTVTLLTQKLFSENAAALLNAPGTTFYDYPEPMIQNLSTALHGVALINASIHGQFTQTFRTVPINGIRPSQDTVETNAYPLVQSLFLYVDQKQLGAPTPTKAVVNSYLIYMSDVIPQVGLLSLSQAQLQQMRNQWLKGIGGN